MTCVACRSGSRRWLCKRCSRSLAPAAEQLRGGIVIRSAFVHEDAARLLVHRLKYEAVAGVADHMAAAVEPLLWAEATALVPIPRVTIRRWQYGVDPASALARAVAKRVGLPVVPALGAPFWVRRRAGTEPGPRARPSFRSLVAAPAGAVLIDDVVTTGATLVVASRIAGPQRAITLTASGSTGWG